MGEHQELALVDVPAWQPKMSELPGGGRVSSMAFSPDSSQLALVYHQPDRDQLLRFDALNGATLASRELPFAVEGMVFVLGGSGLAAFGSSPGELVGISQPGAAQLLLLDFATLEPAWQHALAGVLSGQWCLENCEGSPDEIRFAYFKPAIALSPYRNQLFAVPAGEEIITHLDLKSPFDRSKAGWSDCSPLLLAKPWQKPYRMAPSAWLPSRRMVKLNISLLNAYRQKLSSRQRPPSRLSTWLLEWLSPRLKVAPSSDLPV